MLINNLSKISISVTLSALLVISVNIKNILPETPYDSNEAYGEIKSCKCVVFRLDDIQDRYLDPEQIKIMDLFLSKGAHLTLGLVVNHFGNDTRTLNKISEGVNKGLFELALHGWEHKNYANLSQLEQKNSLYEANEKLQMIFGKRSDMFIPPYNQFNDATLTAIKELGIRILSSNMYQEYKFDQRNSIFTSNGKNDSSRTSQQIYHVPYTTVFKKFVGTAQIKLPIDEVAKDIDNKIDKFGYAVVLIHPQSFIKLDESGNYTDAVKKDVNQAQVDEKDIKDLEYLIDHLTQKGIQISSFHKIINS
jgi:peptidoglycan/xylan/chitin deacetylase (PgdA/CDA1 family)